MFRPIRNSMLAFSLPMFDEDPDSGGAKKDGDPSGKEGSSSKDKGDKEFKPITSQDEFDAMLAPRLERVRRSMAAEVRKEVEDQIREEAEAKAAKDNGDYKALYEAEVKKREALEEKQAEREHEELRTKVAKDAGLPDESMQFLVGKDEAELKASAKKLAELVKPKSATDIDTGRSNENKGKGGGSSQKKEDYEDEGFWLADK